MAKTVLTVVFANTHRTRIAILHENQAFPFSFRTVRIALTPEQEKKIAPLQVGTENGKPVTEERYNAWLEGGGHDGA